LAAAFDLLQEVGPIQWAGVIPITAQQWRRSVSDAGLTDRTAAYGAARARVCSACRDDGRALAVRLRPATIDLAREAGKTCENLDLLATLDPGNTQPLDLIADWREILLEDAHLVLEAAVNAVTPPPAPAWPEGLEVSDDESRDVLLATFGMDSDDLRDDDGAFCDTRVIAFYRLRLGELQAACDPIMEVVTERPPSVFTAVSAVRDLATSTSPFITLSTAKETRSRILDAFSKDPGRTQQVLGDAEKAGDGEWESFRRMQRSMRRAEAFHSSASGTESAYALSLLEAYRHMAEGITRRWVGVMLMLSGLEGPAPGFGGLAEPAVARLGPFGARVSAALDPAIRNAEAHDDVVFDEDTGLLVSGDTSFDPGEILSMLTTLDVLQRGLVVGRLGAFADEPRLGDAILRASSKTSASSALAFARGRFGHAGQRVRSFVRDRDRLDIELDELHANTCNPCFVALTQTAQVLPTVRRFCVGVRGHDGPVLDLPADVLQGNWSVFVQAASSFPDALPQSTFLACLTWCRLGCEPVEKAAHAAAWFALNDAAHAILDANVSPNEFKRLAARFRVVISAIDATVRLLPKGPHINGLIRAQRVIRASERVFIQDPTGVAVRVLTKRIFGLLETFDGPFAVLPTLDPTPAPSSEYPHPVS
jgi:hypothetical protein